MRGKFSKLLAVVLTLALCLTMAVPAYAFSGGFSGSSSKGFSSLWSKITEWYSSQSESDTTDESESTGSVTTLSLVEDETTVDSSDVTLRASTYEATTVDTDENGDTTTGTTTVKYFPVTMFNYDMSTFNSAVAALEDSDSTIATGIYLNSGSASGGTYSITGYSVGYTSVSNSNSGPSTLNSFDANNATKWTITAVDGGYTISSNGYYLTWGGGNSADAMGTDSEVTLSIANASYTSDNKTYTGVTIGLTTSATYKYLNAYGSDGMTFGGYYVDGDDDIGSLFYIYKQSTSSTGLWTKVSVDEITSGGTYVIISARRGYALTLSNTETTITGSRTLASYNTWTGYQTNMDEEQSAVAGNQIYQGLAESTLDSSGNIQFNYTDAGLFTTDTVDGKDVYTNVGLPFEYDSSTRQYSFNAKEMGAWFEGNPASNTNLYYSAYPQGISGSAAEDDTAAYWFPFNDSTNSTLTTLTKSSGTDVQGYNVSGPDYFFGMAASIDFTMTEDGKITYTDEDGNDVTEDIVFHFSGDDDVWVFIDGTLVLDIGGIHNRIDGDIDFASGDWSITQTYGSTTGKLAVDAGTGTTTGSSGNLWNTSDSTGTLNTTLSTFAAQGTHTLTVFYMERGAGASNCEITFNLPMKDYVTVTKEADTDSEGTALTESEQEVVDNMEFTFTIYKDDVAYANQTYTVLNAATGNAIRTASTDASGQFTLHPGETARFTTMFAEDGESWYVVESDPGSAFDSASWSTSDSTVYDVTTTENDADLTSDTLTVKGSAEASSTIKFVCNNILDATLANPGIVPSDDRIVIDYGLPVEIDVKSNDLYRADNYEIVAINGELKTDSDGNVTGYTDSNYTTDSNDIRTYTGSFGTITVSDAENGQLIYQLTSQLTDVEVITYIVEVSSTVVKNETTGETVTAFAYAMATVYVIPATSMYYEEDFLNIDGDTMISYTTGSWKVEGHAETDPQEPGVVGTVGDSPYGSDAAYLADTGDSNGSSKYVSTSESTASFSYTFTGTGTSFFARTTNNSGYMRVSIYDSNNGFVHQEIIDTRYLNTGSENLYNIPVFTWDAEDDNCEYGTYTVKVSLAKNSSKTTYGTDFWLDGIRVQNPMNETSDDYSIAQSAYSADGEASVNIETLRDKVLDAAGYDADGNLTWEDGYAVLTDVDKNIVSASDYESIGPKEEVYLADTNYSTSANAQTISFALDEWDMNYSLYLGLKSPLGSGTTITINGYELKINNTPDCYYDISNYLTVDSTNTDGSVNVSVTITCTDGLVSITNIKSTGSLQFAIIKNTNVSGDSGSDSDVSGEDIDVDE